MSDQIKRSEIVNLVNDGEIELVDFMDGDYVVGIISIGEDEYQLFGEGGDILNGGYKVDLNYLVRCLELDGDEVV